MAIMKNIELKNNQGKGVLDILYTAENVYDLGAFDIASNIEHIRDLNNINEDQLNNFYTQVSNFIASTYESVHHRSVNLNNITELMRYIENTNKVVINEYY